MRLPGSFPFRACVIVLIQRPGLGRPLAAPRGRRSPVGRRMIIVGNGRWMIGVGHWPDSRRDIGPVTGGVRAVPIALLSAIDGSSGRGIEIACFRRAHSSGRQRLCPRHPGVRVHQRGSRRDSQRHRPGRPGETAVLSGITDSGCAIDPRPRHVGAVRSRARPALVNASLIHGVKVADPIPGRPPQPIPLPPAVLEVVTVRPAPTIIAVPTQGV
jgi:hypothetical protein